MSEIKVADVNVLGAEILSTPQEVKDKLPLQVN